MPHIAKHYLIVDVDGGIVQSVHRLDGTEVDYDVYDRDALEDIADDDLLDYAERLQDLVDDMLAAGATVDDVHGYAEDFNEAIEDMVDTAIAAPGFRDRGGQLVTL